MTVQDARSTVIGIIPESAPFSREQRAWLNGFFAGLLAPEVTPGVAPYRGDLPVAAAKALAAENQDDAAPWHDAALPLTERMALAAGRPLRQQLFAAMAQQDCGQCGYLCATYAAALAGGSESKLNLCVPGGKETSRTLKRLLHEATEKPVPPPAASQPAAPSSIVGTVPGCGRDRPVEAVFRSASRLSGEGSGKDTRHVVFDITGTGLGYAPGDSFGLYPGNDAALVDKVLRALDIPADFPIAAKGIHQAHSETYALRHLHQ